MERLTFLSDFSYSIAITTILKSSSKSKKNDSPITAWAMDVDNCLPAVEHFVPPTKADKPKSIYCLPAFALLLISHVCFAPLIAFGLSR